MCFKNLPIEFDDSGKARLKKGVNNPYTYSEQRLKQGIDNYHKIGNGPAGMSNGPVETAKKPTKREFNIDPVTRVAGALGFHTVVDLKAGKIIEANSFDRQNRTDLSRLFVAGVVRLSGPCCAYLNDQRGKHRTQLF